MTAQVSKTSFKDLLHHDSAGGVLLVMTALLALVLANSPLAFLYESFLATPVQVRFGELDIAKPLLLWINDGLMAIFFFPFSNAVSGFDEFGLAFAHRFEGVEVVVELLLFGIVEIGF